MWPISQIKRKLHERRAEYEAQTPEQKAAWRTANATVWIAIFTIVLALVGGITLYEVIAGGNDTRDLAEAAKKQASATTQQMGYTAALAVMAKEQADHTKVAADAAKSAAETASDALKQSQKALLVEQRPWVYVSALNLKPLIAGDPFTVEVWYRNDGKTPAEALGGAVFMYITPVPVSHLEDGPGQPQNKLGMIFPGIVYGPSVLTSTMSGGSRIVDEKDVALFKAEPPLLWVYVYGRIEYGDVFTGKHATSFCGFSNGSNTFRGCPKGVYPTYAQ